MFIDFFGFYDTCAWTPNTVFLRQDVDDNLWAIIVWIHLIAEPRGLQLEDHGTPWEGTVGRPRGATVGRPRVAFEIIWSSLGHFGGVLKPLWEHVGIRNAPECFRNGFEVGQSGSKLNARAWNVWKVVLSTGDSRELFVHLRIPAL